MNRLNCVLLVDDDPSASFINKRVINKLGCAEQVLVALNGQEALGIIQEKCLNDVSEDCPQLILLDVKMPVMDGFEFMRSYEKLQLTSSVKPVVIMLTSSTNPSDLQQAHGLKVAEVLNKPLNANPMQQLLEKYFKMDETSATQATC